MDALYANAVLTAQSKNKLDAGKIRRMLAADGFTSAAAVLPECGYDISKPDDIVINELKKSVDLFCELCPDGAVCDCILIPYTYHNARVLYKARLGLIDAKPALYPFGTANEMKEVYKTLDAAKDLTANTIDGAFDAAMTAEMTKTAAKITDKNIRKYFLSGGAGVLKNSADFFSLEMLLKWFISKRAELKKVKIILMGKKLGLNRDKIRELLNER